MEVVSAAYICCGLSANVTNTDSIESLQTVRQNGGSPKALNGHGQAVDDTLLQYLSPLGWEHINLTGDYLWCSNAKIGSGKLRPLRPVQAA